MDERGEHSAETEKPVTKGPVRITALHEVTKGSFEASLLRTRTCKAEWSLRKGLVPYL